VRGAAGAVPHRPRRRGGRGGPGEDEDRRYSLDKLIGTRRGSPPPRSSSETWSGGGPSPAFQRKSGVITANLAAGSLGRSGNSWDSPPILPLTATRTVLAAGGRGG